jgi:hypothetical protein
MVATWRIVAAALLIFAAGVVTGGITVTFANRATRLANQEKRLLRQDAARPNPATVGTPTTSVTNRNPGFRPPVINRIEGFRKALHQIDLTPEQRQRIDRLLEESAQRVQTAWDPVLARMPQEVREVRRRVDAELTPEQRDQFLRLVGRIGLGGAKP